MPVVTFLSDFGLQDEFAGVCHGVIAGICPDAHVIHVSHGIPPQAVVAGARVLASAVSYLPRGVHLAVVDPGVGSARRGVALRSADGRFFVGPDNGLLMPAADTCGGVDEAVELTNTEYQLRAVSATFHGRDVFAPAAGHLAAGVPLGELGEPVSPGDLTRVHFPTARLDGAVLDAPIEYIDRYGNVRLPVTAGELDGLFQPGRVVEIAADQDRYFARCAQTFADVERGAFILHEDASGFLSVAINQGSAAQLLIAVTGGTLRVDFDPDPPGLEDAGWPS